MKHKGLVRVLAFTLAGILTLGNVSVNAGGTISPAVDRGDMSYVTDSYSNERIHNSYSNISYDYVATPYTGNPIEINAEESLVSATGVLTDDNYGYKNKAIRLEIDDSAEYSVDVPETALYILRFDYLSYDKSILPIELSMKINGSYPFYEARRILLETTWIADEEKSFDRYGNEIVSLPNKLLQWESKFFKDASYYHADPLVLELNQGNNLISFQVAEGSLLLGNMYLEAIEEVSEYTGSELATGDQLITIQAEDFKYRNDSSIRSIAEFEAGLDPYEITNTLMNTIDKDSFKNAGQKITYEFEVPVTGYYYLAMNYRQNDKGDFPVFLDMEIDGKVPNSEFKAYPFDYTAKYKTITLNDYDKNKLSLYLEQGTHTISFTINMEVICHVLESVSRIMSEINDLSLEITKVAGTNKDKYRDLQITRYIPDVEERLYGWANELEQLHDSVKIYSPNTKRIASFSSAFIASNQLRSLAKEPDELPYRVGELSTSINSTNKQLADLLDILSKNRISLDRIYLYQEDAKLPQKPGFLTRIFLSIKRFIASFFDQAYSTNAINKDNIQIWVNRPRQYVELMQKMIDDQFTPETGINVDLSLMFDAQKLVLANSSGDAPDIATGINYALPFDLGIRGAIKDLTEFDDFQEIASRFSPGLHIPTTIGDGIYSLPETMNFWVLFYRTDTFEKLGLKVPDTMQDVIDLLPELQMRGLNFFYPTAQMIALRNFHGTTPLIFQNEAELYDYDTAMTALNTEESIRGLSMLTELFTIYNAPIDVPSFYQHFRNGDLPIGIGDISTYNLLVNAAPEIANSWGISLVPGIKNEEGEILRYTAGGMDNIFMFNSDEKRENDAWEFMKWWTSAEVQTEFGQTLQISYGTEYMWNTANMDAFEALPWDSQNKKVIMEQAEWIKESPRILGTYMLERELSNAFNDIVVQGDTLRIRIDKAIKLIDRETIRKLEEFGYIKDGEVVIDYEVPTLEKVYDILGKENGGR
ncbi:MAG: extracellular solute-binding protein [Anaerolineaceae bacterium]|nr:MAG: extracellular solute-binding protein [Anaerolineaceae bacterium]